MKKIGFLSFGHWSNNPAYNTRSASDTLLQSIDLAVAAEEMGLDGAYFRVHHFAAQLASPFPLLAAIGAKTSKIEIGTGVESFRAKRAVAEGKADRFVGKGGKRGIKQSARDSAIHASMPGNLRQMLHDREILIPQHLG